MTNESSKELRDKLDNFSCQLDARIREFKERGEFSDTHKVSTEMIQERHASIKEKLDSAVLKGTTWDVIKREFEQSFNTLSKDFAQLEKKLDAESMKRKEQSS